MLTLAATARPWGFGFHPLKGKPKRWAVSVDENYRVTFRCEDGHALEVDYGDLAAPVVRGQLSV
jgi:proteic killer suppression protein